jgi:endoglucanase
MNELKFVPVTDGMFPLLGKVYAQAWKGANSFFSTPEHLKKQTPEKKAERFRKQQKREKNLRFYLIYLGEDPIGMYSMTCYPNGTGEIRKLYLLPAYCGKGYGVETLLHILDENKDLQQIFLWVLERNERAVRFYSKCGFISTGDTEEVAPEIELKAYKMVLDAPLAEKAAAIRPLLRARRQATDEVADMLHVKAAEPEETIPEAPAQPQSAPEPKPAVEISDKDDLLLIGWLHKLCTAVGIAGEEDAACAVAAELLRSYTDDVRIDQNHNVIARLCAAEPGQPEILLDAHIDEIGMLVTHLEADGFVRVTNDGGIDKRLLAGQEVLLHGSVTIPGVVAVQPPHLTNEEERRKVSDVTDILIDTGYPKEELEKILTPGDGVTIRSRFTQLLNRQVSSKALDDRSCAVAILYALELTKGEKLPCGVTVVFSAQEEIGGHGAMTAAFAVQPDQALVSDVSFAYTPDADRNECGDLGKGVMVGVAPILDKKMTEKLRRLAEQQQIPYQLEVMGGRTGTNADSIFKSGKGVRTALLSLPQKYMHTPIEVVSLADIVTVGQLMAAYLREPAV